MASPLSFSTIGRRCDPTDNVAIAVRRLEADTAVEIAGVTCRLSHTVLEGHRFVIRPIAAGEPLTSWGLPFGHALRALQPGDYVCNQSMLDALAVRQLDLQLPAQPNFADHLVPFAFDPAAFRPAPPVALVPEPERRTFAGYLRPGRRGVGTRNVIVVLGTSSRTASLARELVRRLQPLAPASPSFDGVVAVAHTEGGGTHEPNNAQEVLRALAGFLVHPNVGAILALDVGVEPISNARLEAFAREHGYPLSEVPHAFLSVTGRVEDALRASEKIIRAWLPEVTAARRSPQPASALRLALQCGGSDAFSGVSGNPLAGRIVHEVVRQGGCGVLCETDELGGAEAYIVRGIRDLETARALFGQIDRTRERLGWHGVTFESNPSAGNKLRGLYNLTLKSLGAVHKKDPRTRIDQVIDYAVPLHAPGFYFMDSPGNDLEAIAGEVAAGCNLILFITGNGSITNFPFVPTLKITTTTRRHQLLVREMDLNAGRYLDGEAMEALTAEGLELVLATASGQRTRGEQAGHSQTSLWREWRQTDTTQLPALRARPAPDGKPLVPAASPPPTDERLNPVVQLVSSAAGYATERVGLVLPTSLCAAQIARLAAERLQARGDAASLGFDRFVALPHSEGCGFGGETMYQRLYGTYLGYAIHPNVADALLLEHGCEKISNDAMRRQFERAGLPLERFGWASVQLDGGIDRALAKVEDWFISRGGDRPKQPRQPARLSDLTVGVLSAGVVGASVAQSLAVVVERLLASGASVLLPENDPLLARLEQDKGWRLVARCATLASGQRPVERGLHLCATESDHWVENVTALAANGAHLVLGGVTGTVQPGHPLIPVLTFDDEAASKSGQWADVDLVVPAHAGDAADLILRQLIATVEGAYTPVGAGRGLVDFQISRGLLGVST